MDPLARLLGSPARLKVLRLFIFNQDSLFTLEDVVARAKLTREAGRKELAALLAAGVIKRRSGKGGVPVYSTDTTFEHLGALDAFIRQTCILRPEDILNALKKAGTLKLVVLSGTFTGTVESQIDLLVVGDALEEKGVERVISILEAELGREIRYAFFTTADFRYRLGVYDRLLRDMFDYPHRTILDKIGLK
ncbi:MAG TPA: hypothetical protein VM103_00680 [Candidatus Paceibacterota bacterium]|nr:hypothetical protein [Candidatus Paceibacterota bacterium]